MLFVFLIGLKAKSLVPSSINYESQVLELDRISSVLATLSPPAHGENEEEDDEHESPGSVGNPRSLAPGPSAPKDAHVLKANGPYAPSEKT